MLDIKTCPNAPSTATRTAGKTADLGSSRANHEPLMVGILKLRMLDDGADGMGLLGWDLKDGRRELDK